MAGKKSTPPTSSSQILPCGRTLSKKPRREAEAKRLMETMGKRLNAYVTEKKLNRSDARSKILEVIVRQSHHFRAQDLVDELHSRFPEVGRSTLYRNLPIFVESGLIQEGPSDPDGQILYELSEDEHHDHIVCIDCKTIFEFHDEPIETRQAEVSHKLGFTVRDHRHVVYASCDLLANIKNKRGTIK